MAAIPLVIRSHLHASHCFPKVLVGLSNQAQAVLSHSMQVCLFGCYCLHPSLKQHR